MTKLEIFHHHPNQWVLVRVTKENEIGELVEGEVLCASPDRDVVYQAIGKVEKGAKVATLFTGEVLPEGQSFSF